MPSRPCLPSRGMCTPVSSSQIIRALIMPLHKSTFAFFPVSTVCCDLWISSSPIGWKWEPLYRTKEVTTSTLSGVISSPRNSTRRLPTRAKPPSSIWLPMSIFKPSSKTNLRPRSSLPYSRT